MGEKENRHDFEAQAPGNFPPRHVLFMTGRFSSVQFDRNMRGIQHDGTADSDRAFSRSVSWRREEGEGEVSKGRSKSRR